MGQVTNRTSLTSRGFVGLAPWNEAGYEYSVLQINLGNNPISKIEVVSLLNLLDLGFQTLYYTTRSCPQKYNPKVYLGAIQSVAREWILDLNNGLKSDQKSGSWFTCFMLFDTII